MEVVVLVVGGQHLETKHVCTHGPTLRCGTAPPPLTPPQCSSNNKRWRADRRL